MVWCIDKFGWVHYIHTYACLYLLGYMSTLQNSLQLEMSIARK